jgi:hypothetical protein
LQRTYTNRTYPWSTTWVGSTRDLLQQVDIVTEFRLLRQEIDRALWAHMSDAAPTSDVVGAELLVHDALDSAITLASPHEGPSTMARRARNSSLFALNETSGTASSA